MIHQFKNNGYNIVLDVNSGAIHVVDDLTYDIIGMYEEEDQDRIRERMAEKYPKVSEADIEEVFAEIKALIDDQSLFTPDHYETYMDDVLKRRPTVVKALCLNVAHDCNLACKYCFADEGTYCGGPRELRDREECLRLSHRQFRESKESGGGLLWRRTTDELGGGQEAGGLRKTGGEALRQEIPLHTDDQRRSFK